MANGRVTQERVVVGTSQTSNGRVTQERVLTAVLQTSNGRVTQERLVYAYQPGVFTNAVSLLGFRGAPRCISVSDTASVGM